MSTHLSKAPREAALLLILVALSTSEITAAAPQPGAGKQEAGNASTEQKAPKELKKLSVKHPSAQNSQPEKAQDSTTPKSTAAVKPASEELTAEEILKKADEIRNPAESYLMKVHVISGVSKEEKTPLAEQPPAEGTQKPETEETGQASVFEVAIEGNDKTLVRTLDPIRDRGRDLLMLGEQMWAYIPNLGRSVRVSLSQKLTGQAANGDISRMRWSGDYTAQIERETDQEWVLFLTASRKGLTYEKLRVWIEKATFHPLQAEFLTLSDKILKKATYQQYKELAGALRPSEIQIQDAIRKNQISLIQIQELSVKTFPKSLFHQNSFH